MYNENIEVHDKYQQGIPSQENVQLVTFEVKQQLFGVDVALVQEVIRSGPITETPGSLDIIEGVIDLRGNIIPVVDLRKRFNMEQLKDRKGQRIIIVEAHEYIFGFIVDRVNEVHTFSVSEFEPPPPGVSAPGSEYTLGMVHIKDTLLLFLDIIKVLDFDRLLKEL